MKAGLLKKMSSLEKSIEKDVQKNLETVGQFNAILMGCTYSIMICYTS